MENSTTIKNMLGQGEISVPDYQRAYSWGSDQIETLLNDLDEHIQSRTKSPFYFGHFLFEERGTDKFCVIDGQQRLTSIVILVSVILKILEDEHGQLDESQKEIKKSIVQNGDTLRFNTVDYDNERFREVVIEHKDISKLKSITESQKNISVAYKYFNRKLKSKKTDKEYLNDLLCIIVGAKCTTYPIKQESEAVQLFIFQNDRGKPVTNLEKLKAQFMHYILLHGGKETKDLLRETKDKFESIYKNISKIEGITEDDILRFTTQICFDSLVVEDHEGEINAILRKEAEITDPIFEFQTPTEFIAKFIHLLKECFEYTSDFIGKGKKHVEIHSLLTVLRLGGRNIAFPFILKALKSGINNEDLTTLCKTLESIIFRDRVNSTRKQLIKGLNECYEYFDFTQNLSEVIKCIEDINEISDDDWWGTWNDNSLKRALNGSKFDDKVAKFILWKYENYLNEKSGDNPILYNELEKVEVEHIAPKTEPEKPHGYGRYNEKFLFSRVHIHTLGNLLLLSKLKNISIGNKIFSDKLKAYAEESQFKQQGEIKKIAKKYSLEWDSPAIKERTEKIVKAIMSIYK